MAGWTLAAGQRSAARWDASDADGRGARALCAAPVRVVARAGLDGVTFRGVEKEAGVTTFWPHTSSARATR